MSELFTYVESGGMPSVTSNVDVRGEKKRSQYRQKKCGFDRDSVRDNGEERNEKIVAALVRHSCVDVAGFRMDKYIENRGGEQETTALASYRLGIPDKYAEVLLNISNPHDGYTAERIRRMYGNGERDIQSQPRSQCI